MNYPDVLLPKEAAKLLGISYSEVIEKAESGEIKSINLSNRPRGARFLKRDIEELIHE